MKKILAFDVDDTLNVAKTPITEMIAELLVKCLDHFEVCPISGQKFDQFLIQIVDRLPNPTPKQLSHLHLLVAQGTQYYRFDPEAKEWRQIYNHPLNEEQVAKITNALEQAAREFDLWEEDKLAPGDEIIENRLSQVTFSALGQKASPEAKYAWDPDHKKREKIAARCKELAPEFEYLVAGTTSIDATMIGIDKSFGMKHLLEELGVDKSDVLYFGDMTQPGGNDYPIKEMGIDVVTVRNYEDTGYALKGILGVLDNS